MGVKQSTTCAAASHPWLKSNPKSQLLELVFTGSSTLASSLPASIFPLAELEEEETSTWTNYTHA